MAQAGRGRSALTSAASSRSRCKASVTKRSGRAGPRDSASQKTKKNQLFVAFLLIHDDSQATTRPTLLPGQF